MVKRLDFDSNTVSNGLCETSIYQMYPFHR